MKLEREQEQRLTGHQKLVQNKIEVNPNSKYLFPYGF